MAAKSTVPFQGTKEQEAQLRSVIAELKDERGALMPILQKAQDIYGYLPIEVQTMIADECGIPLEKVYGVATFYSQFSLYPKGKYKISVCLGTACYVKGSGDLQQASGITRYRGWSVYPGRQVLFGRMSLYRCLRSCSGIDH